MGRGDVTVLDERALNRATLARQMMLGREAIPAVAAVERLVGLQAQAPVPPYFALWTRVAGFRPEELGEDLLARRVVRASLQRGTIHLVSARDCLFLWPLLRPMLARLLAGMGAGKLTASLDLEPVMAAGRELLAERPRTNAELGRLLGERWPGWDEGALAQVVQYLTPTVQIPPRGVWGQSGQATWVPMEAWLGAPLEQEPAMEDLIRRYLGAFGPASVADAQKWSGLRGLTPVFGRMRSELVTFRDERGRELFDLPTSPRPEAEMPVPVRFLGEFDSVLLGHADRTRIISDADRARVFTINGIVRATVLVDGFVRGMWTIERARTTATLVITLFATVGARERAAMEAEGMELMRFGVGDAAQWEVRVVEDGDGMTASGQDGR